MRSCLRGLVVLGLALGTSHVPAAQDRSAAMVVRVDVVRMCAIDTRTTDVGDATVALTCSRGAVRAVAARQPGAPARIVPLPARKTTVVARMRGVEGGNDAADRRQAPHRIVTINF